MKENMEIFQNDLPKSKSKSANQLIGILLQYFSVLCFNFVGF